MDNWFIDCNTCGHVTDPGTIHKLARHCNEDGWFVCSKCKQRGHIKNTIQQHKERENPITASGEPYLLGLGGIMRQDIEDRDRNYYPFVFMAGNHPERHATNMWFCYYKDTRTLKGKKSWREGNLQMDRGSSRQPAYDFKQHVELTKAIFGIDYADVDIVLERNGELIVIDHETI